MYKGYAKGVCGCGNTTNTVAGSVKIADRKEVKRKFHDLAAARFCKDCRGRTEQVAELYVRQVTEGES